MVETKQMGGVITITRVFDAPRELAWKAWTEPERIMRWWGPKDFTSPACEVDLREGGKYLFCMRSLDGEEFWTTGTYKEIVPMERIVFTDAFADKDGNKVPAAEYGFDEDFPEEMLVTLVFEEENGKTKLTLSHAGLPAGEHSEGAEQGWNESLDKLAESLKEFA